MEKSPALPLTPTSPPAGYAPQSCATPDDALAAAATPYVDAGKMAYAQQQPIRMVRQPSEEQKEEPVDLRGGRTGECCLYCCGIVVLIKCLDSICG